MGLKDMAAKSEAAKSEATRAFHRGLAIAATSRGQTVYVPELAKTSGLVGSLDAWGIAIEAVEGQGWRLEHWAIDAGGVARPVFRAEVRAE